MKLLTDIEIAALKDGADALLYRAGRLRSHHLFDQSKPDSETVAEAYERHAAILREIAQKEM
jgi:hypothetical protein